MSLFAVPTFLLFLLASEDLFLHMRRISIFTTSSLLRTELEGNSSFKGLFHLFFMGIDTSEKGREKFDRISISAFCVTRLKATELCGLSKVRRSSVVRCVRVECYNHYKFDGKVWHERTENGTGGIVFTWNKFENENKLYETRWKMKFLFWKMKTRSNLFFQNQIESGIENRTSWKLEHHLQTPSRNSFWW